MVDREEEYMDPVDQDIEEEFAREDESDKQSDAYDDRMGPEHQGSPSYWDLFWRVVKTDDSRKVANLTKEELGMPEICVRDCHYIAELARQLGKNGFATWFENRAEITQATSLSKDGFQQGLFVTQRKESKKSRGDVKNLKNQGAPSNKKSGGYMQ